MCSDDTDYLLSSWRILDNVLSILFHLIFMTLKGRYYQSPLIDWEMEAGPVPGTHFIYPAFLQGLTKHQHLLLSSNKFISP